MHCISEPIKADDKLPYFYTDIFILVNLRFGYILVFFDFFFLNLVTLAFSMTFTLIKASFN